MIKIDQIQHLIKEVLTEKDCFIVDLAVREGNNILLEIDSINGVTITDCVAFSRAIEHNLDREVEDFELHVSSPGLDKPFKVKEQFYKNVGREVKVTLTEGKVVKGKLKEVIENEGIIVEFSFKRKIEGKKKKEKITQQEKITFNHIKEISLIISFKK